MRPRPRGWAATMAMAASALVSVAVACAGAAPAGAAPEVPAPAPAPATPVPANGTVTLRALAARYRLTYVEEALSGRVLLVADGPRLVAVNGMSGVLVGGRYVVLPERVRILDGEYLLPTAGLPAIEAALGAVAPPAAVRPVTPRAGGPPLTRIVLDPGHGGNDPGTHGASGLKEKALNLDVARRVRDLLLAEGLQVFMTRDSDRALATTHKDNLRLRSEFSHAKEAELYVSIHTNANRERSLRGFEVYYPRDEYRLERVADATREAAIPASVLGTSTRPSPAVTPILWDALYDEYYRESRELAEEVRRGLAALPTSDRGTHAAGFYVLRWAHCPAILIEMEYVTNPTGEAALARPEYRQQIAQAIAHGILSFRRKFSGQDRFNR